MDFSRILLSKKFVCNVIFIALAVKTSHLIVQVVLLVPIEILKRCVVVFRVFMRILPYKLIVCNVTLNARFAKILHPIV